MKREPIDPGDEAEQRLGLGATGCGISLHFAPRQGARIATIRDQILNIRLAAPMPAEYAQLTAEGGLRARASRCVRGRRAARCRRPGCRAVQVERGSGRRNCSSWRSASSSEILRADRRERSAGVKGEEGWDKAIGEAT